MKSRILFLVFLMFYLIDFAQTSVQYNRQLDMQKSYSLNNIIAITPSNEYSAPKWSPDGKKIFFTSIGFKGLYLVFLDNINKVILLNTLAGSGYNAGWSKDSEMVFYRYKDIGIGNKSFLEVKGINILTKEVNNYPNINPDGIESNCLAEINSDPIVYTNSQTLLIEAQTLDKGAKWIITNSPGQYYQAILSPDKKMVVTHKDGEMFVFNIDGNGLISSLGKGIANSWSSDSKQILYFIGEDDGHSITGSEIYLCNFDGTRKWQLTKTPNIIEMFPTWSPDNKRIAYSDDKSGTIYIATLKMH